MKILFVRLKCRDLAASQRFYQQVFELSVEEALTDAVLLRSATGAYLKLELSRYDPPASEWFLFGFDAETDEGLRAAHERAKACTEHTTQIFGGKLSRFMCIDPDGHHIEVHYDPEMSHRKR